MEYGSNYPLEFITPNKSNFEISGQLAKSNIYYMVNGRSAIYTLAKHLRKFKTVYLPNYLCEDVYKSFYAKERKFYELNKSFAYKSGLEEIRGEKFILYISNYFGLSDEGKLFRLISKLKKDNEVFVIYDITHNLYSVKPNSNIDAYVSSLRKWMPIADGALLATDLKIELSEYSIDVSTVEKFITASYLKKIYTSFESDPFNNMIYRERFAEVEHEISKILKPLKMSQESYISYRLFNHDDMMKRRENYKLLLSKLNNSAIVPVFNDPQELSIPFCFPIICKQRDKLRKYLADHKIYCAIHWSQSFLLKSKYYNSICEQILSIPIDQRSGAKDIIELANVLNKFGGLDV